MAIGHDIEERGHITGFREEINRAAAESPDRFFTWFDEARDADAAFIRGAWDFQVHVASPLGGRIQNPEDLCALEIGHGGGRLLAAAARSFGRVTGVDIHDQNERVAALLKQRGIHNFELLRSTGSRLPVPDASIDVVYSFIVLQHVEKYRIFCDYLGEASRVLRPGGLAVLYFARWQMFSHCRSAMWRYHLDSALERLALRSGFKEVAERVNCINLLVRKGHAEKLAKALGFRVESRLISRRRAPDQADCFGLQNGLVLRKPR